MTTDHLRATAVTGAVAFAFEGALELVHKQAQPFASVADRLIEAAFAAGLWLTLAGLVALHRRHAAAAGRLGLAGVRIAAAGQGAVGLAALATLVRGQDALGPLFGLGVLAWVAGGVLLAVAARRAEVLPRWAGPLLPLALVVSFVLPAGGTLLLAAAWTALIAGPLAPGGALRPGLA